MSTEAAASALPGQGGLTGTAAASTGMAPAAGSTGSAAGSTGSGPAFTWGEGWREQIAAGDADERKRLERFPDPSVIYKSFRELEKKQSSGELRQALPEKPSPEELASYRKAMGIPEQATGYKINMPQGREQPKEDDAFLNAFLQGAHKANYTQGQVDAALSSFYAEVDRQMTAVEEARVEAERATDAALRVEWGADYKTNKAMAENLLARAPAGFRDRFLNGYLEDNTPIKASPEAWKWLVQLEREANPLATVVPGGGDPGKALVEEINSLKEMMGDKNSEYWKGPKADQLQARYRELISVQQQLAARAQG